MAGDSGKPEKERVAIGDPSDVAALPWWGIAKETWKEAGEDNLSLVASGIAFNIFLAFVPLLTSVILTYGLVAAPSQAAQHIATLTSVLPEQAADIVGSQLRQIVNTASSETGLGLIMTLAIALYGAERGAGGIISGLNIIFDIEETRSYLRQLAVAIAITLGMVLIFIIASVGISVVNFLSVILPDLGGFTHSLLRIAFWIAAALAVSTVIAVIYRYAPNREDPHWPWLTAGSFLATVVWLVGTFLFGLYVQNFGSYNAIYGALGAVIVFLLWLYLSAYILLAGAELNQVLARCTGGQQPRAREEPSVDQ